MRRRSRLKNERQVRLWRTLRWRLVLFVLAIIFSSGILTALVHLLLETLFAKSPVMLAITLNPYVFSLVLLGVCTVIGTCLAVLFGKYYLRPLKRLSLATKEVKRGNFKVRVKQENHSMSEMGILVSDFNDMVRELDSIELFRNDFINNFSHEFKTPIVSIRGFARELQRGELDEATRAEYIRIIAEESDRLANLSGNVLELSRLENQQVLSGKRAFSLDEQLRQSILLFEALWEEKELEILPELEEVRIFSNEDILAHVWKNLLSNAIKFTPRGGSIRVTLQSVGESAVVTVSDTGEGMSEEVKARVFEKFYQGDPSHHGGGHGVGLALADKAARLCGGRIEVESQVGMGSTFTVTLPKGDVPTDGKEKT